MPGGGNPQPVRDADGLELGLRQAYPVLLFHAFGLVRRHGQFAGGAGGGDQQRDVGIFGKQGDDAAVIPQLVHRHAGFAEDGLFQLGAGQCVLNGGRQRAGIHQGIGQAFCHGRIRVDGGL